MKNTNFTAKDNSELENMIEKLGDDESLIHYKNYCEKRLEGLRKEAFAEMNLFLKNFVAANFEQRKRFVNIILQSADDFKNSLTHNTMPTPLNVQMISPTLDEWGKIESANYLPFYWKAKYFYDDDALEYAIKLNPSEQKPLLLSLERDINVLSFSTHHLPEGYIGNIHEDLLLIEKIEEKICLVTDESVKKALTDDFLFYKELVNNYYEWKQSGEENLEEWGAKNSKIVSSNVKAFYYTK